MIGAAVLIALSTGGYGIWDVGSGTAANNPRTQIPDPVSQILRRGEQLAPLNSLLIWQDNKLVGERYYRGMRADRAVNVKSASKSVISALVGIAVQQKKLRLEQPIAELLPARYFARITDPQKRAITVRHLLTMTAGLESTSFDNYGAWVASRDWAQDALRRPMVCAPGSCMTYSTGSSHLLSIILTRASGMTTLEFANRNLFRHLGSGIGGWTRDPQGFYLGGNEMHMTPRQLLRFGRLYLNGGKFGEQQVLSHQWIRESWGEYATSPWNGHRYGYGWWTRRSGAHNIHFAWGYGGQFVFVVPDLELVVVMTSTLTARRDGSHLRRLHDFMDEITTELARIRA